MGHFFAGKIRRHRNRSRNLAYTAVSDQDQADGLPNGPDQDVEMAPPKAKPSKGRAPRYKQKLPFRSIFTSNVLCTLLAHGILAAHVGTFNSLCNVFLSTPVADPETTTTRLPFIFSGGLGMPPRDVGLAMATLGTIGINMQLFVYPRVNARLGTVRSWRIFLYCFPIAYILMPFLAIVPSKTPPPAEKDGVLVWLALTGVLLIQVIGRTFALPATTILVNNCSPHPSVLGTIHGIGQSVSSGARTVGPVLGGWLYGVGLNHGVMVAVWWCLSGIAVMACVASNWVFEGDGHEIRLDGDDEAEAEAEAAIRR